MHSSSLVFFAVVLIIALHTLPISGKAVKQTATTTTTTASTTLVASPVAANKGAVTTKTPAKGAATITVAPAKGAATTTVAPAKGAATTVAAAGAAKVDKKKKKGGKKSKKPKKTLWKAPDADQKKLFNDYKVILRKKLNDRQQNISATYQLEPTKAGSQVDGKSILHHYLIKLPDSKYAHAIIGLEKDAKKPAVVNEHNASIRRTIYDNLAAAEV